MQWFYSHPYTMFIVSAFVLLLFGFVIVQERSPVARDSTTTVWGGGGVFLYPNLEPAQLSGGQISSDIYGKVQDLPPFMYTPPTQTIDTGGTEDSFDFAVFLAELSRPKKTTTTPGGNTTPEAYSYIPKSFVATVEPPPERTERQEALYKYGNEVGSSVQLFEDRNRSMARVLKDQFEDPTNQEKATALTGLGEAMANLGTSLETIESVPGEASTAHKRLIESYKAMGTKLALVPNASSDEEKIAAMLTYNGTVEEFTRRYISLVTLFSLAGVTFSTSDPGSIFTFSSSGF